MFNPDFIIINCHHFAANHCFAFGEIVPTTRRNIEGTPDKNGYTIYINGLHGNIRLISEEYRLLTHPENDLQVIDLDIIWGGHGHNIV